MSFFADIFISKYFLPEKIRTGCTPWTQIPDTSIYISLSKRINKNDSPIYYCYDDNEFQIIIIGELYSYKNEFLRNGTFKIREKLIFDISNLSIDYLELNGHFIVVVFNKIKKEYEVITQRLGTYHIYYQNSKGKEAISTYYGALKQLSERKLDWFGIGSFFNLGFFINNTTYYKDIELLSAASSIVFDSEINKLSEKKYWKLNQRINRNLSFSQFLERFKIIIEDITVDISGGRIAVPISGGLDSRTLAATISNIKKENVWYYSYGYTTDSIETSIAEKIAIKRSLPFEKYKISNYLFDKLQQVKESVELFQYVDGTRQADIVDELSKHADFVIAAHWGDVWLGDMGLVDQTIHLDNQSLAKYGFKKLAKKGRTWFNSNFKELREEEIEKIIIKDIQQQIFGYEHFEEDDFKIKALKTNQWSRRWTLASIRMYQEGAFPRLPFYDNRMIDFCETIPSKFIKTRKLQVEYLKKYHRDLAKIKWEEYRANLFQFKVFNNRLLIYRAISKIYRTFSKSVGITRNWEIFYLGEKNRSKLESLLFQNFKFLEVVPKEKIQNILEQFYAKPNADNGFVITTLLTFSLLFESE